MSISVSFTQSRTTGVAPLSVFFDARATTSTDTTNPFHDIYYEWDFGDPSSGTWSTGARPGVASKNKAIGALAFHLFTTPGSYTVTLRAWDGTDWNSQTVGITVTDPDTVYSGDTLYVSTDGDFTGVPGGAATTTTSDYCTAINTTANRGIAYKRILFKRGQTFTSTNVVNIKGANGGTVGAWGSGAKPILNCDQFVFQDIGPGDVHTWGDWRLMDLDIRALSAQWFAYVTGTCTNLTYYNLDIRDFDIGFNGDPGTINSVNSSSLIAPIWNRFALVDNTWYNQTEYIILCGMDESALAGNNVPTLTQQHCVRFPTARRNLIQHNNLRGTGNGNALTIRGANFSAAEIATTSVTYSGGTNGVISITTAAPHNLQVGWSVRIFGVTPSGYNSNYQVATVPSSTQLTIQTSGGFADPGGPASVQGFVTGRLTYEVNKFTYPDQTYTEYNIVSDNRLITNSAGSIMTFDATGDGSRPRMRYNIVERNWIVNNSGSSHTQYTRNCQLMTFRNNVYDTSGTTNQANLVISQGNDTTDDYTVYYNTVYGRQAGSGTGFNIVSQEGTIRNAIVKNNLGIAVGTTGTILAINLSGTGLDISNNSTNAQCTDPSPLATNPPVAPVDWTPTIGSYTNSGGADNIRVFDDFLGNIRNWNSTSNDIGAVALNTRQAPWVVTKPSRGGFSLR